MLSAGKGTQEGGQHGGREGGPGRVGDRGRSRSAQEFDLTP